MALLEAIKNRYSVRSYLEKPVEKQKIDIILESARLAPSAKNFQDWRFIVVQDRLLKMRLMEAANNQAFVGQAPVVIVCCSVEPDYVMRCGQPVCSIDAAIALEHIALRAVEEGLGTCWVGSFYEDKVKAIFDIPGKVRVVQLMTLGYPANKHPGHNRMPIDSIVSHDKWAF